MIDLDAMTGSVQEELCRRFNQEPERIDVHVCGDDVIHVVVKVDSNRQARRMDEDLIGKVALYVITQKTVAQLESMDVENVPLVGRVGVAVTVGVRRKKWLSWLRG